MIQIYLRGGLGNTMFQYAAAKVLAIRLNTDLEINVTYVERDPIRKYELGAFPRITESIVREMRGNVIQEQGIPFDPKLLANIHVDVTLIGYFQSELYFADYADEIRKIFFAPVARGLKSIPSTAVHIRRGDTIPPNGVMAVLDPNYYARAVETLGTWPDAESTHIFTDDPEWCRTNCQWGRVLDPHQAADDLFWMSRYEKIVMANSSYSWWAAWLSGHDNVIAPEKWFTKECGLDSRDIIPARWRKI